MTNYIIPSNPSNYKVIQAFQELNIINWVQHKNSNKGVVIGDIFYIYSSAPDKRLIVKAEVIDKDLLVSDIDDRKYVISDEYTTDGDKWFKLRLLNVINSNVTSDDLKEFGLKGNVQSLRKLDDSIVKRIEAKLSISEPDLDTEYCDGKIKKIYTTTYERNPINRQKALSYHGYSCAACGFNFEEVYGELGKGFIEVHHIVPLSMRDEEVKVNPKTDLIPLCPNCHRMIHHKKNRILTIDELKKILAKH